MDAKSQHHESIDEKLRNFKKASTALATLCTILFIIVVGFGIGLIVDRNRINEMTETINDLQAELYELRTPSVQIVAEDPVLFPCPSVLTERSQTERDWSDSRNMTREFQISDFPEGLTLHEVQLITYLSHRLHRSRYPNGYLRVPGFRLSEKVYGEVTPNIVYILESYGYRVIQSRNRFDGSLTGAIYIIWDMHGETPFH